MTLMVALLLATFVLTAVLTLRAHRADVARQAQTRGILQDMVNNAASQWQARLDDVLVSQTRQSLNNALGVLLSQGDASVTELAARTNLGVFCEPCDFGDAPTYFLVDREARTFDHHGGAERVSDALIEAIEGRVAIRDFALIHDLIGVGVFTSSDSGRVEVAAATVRLNEDGSVARIFGWIVPPEVLAVMLRVVFQNLPLIPQSMAVGLQNDGVFTARAWLGEMPIIEAGTTVELPGIARSRATPIPNVVLEVGFAQSAAASVIGGGALETQFPVMPGLLLAIAVLLVLALMLVRREAELARLRADFVSSVTHELRTPLAQIRMFTETLLLGRTRSDVERRRSLEIIEQETRRLAQLVENILLFSRTEGGRGTAIDPVAMDFAEAIRAAVDSFAPMCRASGTELRTELQEGITVPVDSGALRQIMVNLVDNALKYGPAGQRVTIGAALFGDVARVWVDDEGAGVPLAERERIFESFYRMPRDIMSGATGSGIGLAIVQQLASLHGGSARAETAPGGGARLVVDFPDAYLRASAAVNLAAAS
jgi:signal transduction histidine kinase